MTSSWRPPRSGVPRESILRKTLFNIFINSLDDGAECALCKFAGDVKLGVVIDTLGGVAIIQRDLDRLKKSAGRNLMRFNRGKWTSPPALVYAEDYPAGRQLCRKGPGGLTNGSYAKKIPWTTKEH